MKKHGFLLAEETLKLIIGVIAIGFLAYFLISLYFSAQASKELEQAKETLPFIMNQIKQGRVSVDIYNPKDWWLKSWPNEIGAPRTCVNIGSEGCICLCEENSAESCDEGKVCVYDEGFSVEQGTIKIENPPMKLNIKYGLDRISKEE